MNQCDRRPASGHSIGRWLAAATIAIGVIAFSNGCERQENNQAPTPAVPQPQAAAPAEAAAGRASVGVLPEGAEKPNVIFIMIDALRADRLGAYGCQKNLTPTMDGLAKVGVTFTYCVAPAPWTLPSIASLFTAYYPGVHKATSYRTVEDMEQGRTVQQSVLSDDFTTLAEVLKANGYDTAGFCGNKFIREQYGFAQGFDHFDTSFADNTVPGSKINEAAFAWLGDRLPDKPFFLYLHYMDVHGPYDAAPQFMDPQMERVEANENKRVMTSQEFGRLNAYLKKPPAQTSDPGRYDRLKGYQEYWAARYDAGVAEADFHLEKMLKHLTEMGVLHKSLVILVADHGEALCEHGMWGHGYSEHQTDLHVPLIMVWNKVLPAGQRVQTLSGVIDLMPTIMEQLRIPVSDELQGKSLVGHLSGTLPARPQMRFAEAVKSGPPEFAVFVGPHKMIMKQVPARRMPDGSTSQPTVSRRLFNLATDANEEFDTGAQDPQRRDLLSKLIEGFVRTNQKTKPEVAVERRPVEVETMSQLESLGYVGGSEEDDPNEAAETEPPPTSAPSDEP